MTNVRGEVRMAGERQALVSVVIPFAGDPDQLLVQLDAVGAQRSAGRVEVVISANRRGGAAEVRRLLERHRPWDPQVTASIVDSSGTPGPSAARNAGWRASSGDPVLFCDADDECRPGWIAAMTAELARHGVVRGRQDYAVLNPRPFAFSRLDHDEHPTKFHHLPFGPSSNLGVRRDLLQRLGGFDERLTVGEDIDLCWRAQYAGATLGYAADAVVDYRLRDSPAAVFRQGVAYGGGDARLLRLHRGRGARRTVLDSACGVAALGVLALAAVGSGPARMKLALEAGGLIGRLRSSLRERVWAV